MAECELSAEDFNKPAHQVIFQAIEDMISQQRAMDLVTLTEYLRQGRLLDEAGGVSYLATMAKETPTAANVAAYAGIVKSRSMARNATQIAQGLIGQAGDPGAVDEAIRSLMDLTVKDRTDSTSVQDTLKPVLQEIGDRSRGISKPGLKTGLKRLDAGLGGLYPGDLYVVAARPGGGKTAFGAGIILANPEIPSGFMSMEQPRTQIVQRMIASVGSLNAHALRLGKLGKEDWPRINQAVESLYRLPCEINDRPAPPIDVIVRQARKWRYEKKIQLLVVDYIQRIRSVGKEKRHEQVEAFARALKEIARELDIPVVALSQVSRGVEARNDKRPQMADLRDSGAIEMEADAIITLYRPEVYDDDPSLKGVAEVAVIKSRHGPIGKVTCHFNGASIRYEDDNPDDIV